MAALRGVAGNGMLFLSESIAPDAAQRFARDFRSRAALPAPEILKLVPEACAGIRTYGKSINQGGGADAAAAHLEAAATKGKTALERSNAVVHAAIELYTREDLKIKGKRISVGWLYREVNARLRNAESVRELAAEAIWTEVRRVAGDLYAFARLMYEAIKVLRPATTTVERLFRGMRVARSVWEEWAGNVERVAAMTAFQSFSQELAEARKFPVEPKPPPSGFLDIFVELESMGRPTIVDLMTETLKHEKEVLIHPFSLVRVASANSVMEGRPLLVLKDVEVCKVEAVTAMPASGKVPFKFRIEGEKEVKKMFVKRNDCASVVLAAVAKLTRRSDLRAIVDTDGTELLEDVEVGDFVVPNAEYTIATARAQDGPGSGSGSEIRAIARIAEWVPMWNRVCCVVIGNPGVGKSSLVAAAVGGEVHAGASAQAATYQLESGAPIGICFWEVPSQATAALRRLSYSDSEVFLICYAAGDGESLAAVPRWKGEIPRGARSLLVRCKSDAPGSDADAGAQMVARFGVQGFVECSAVTGRGVNLLPDAVAKVLAR